MEVDVPCKVAQELVLHDLLVECRVFAALACLARIFLEELALRDAGAGEGVGLDDVRARDEEALVDVADDIGPREREDVAVVLEILRRVLEALTARVRLGQAVAADGRAHGPVDDEDAFAQFTAQFFGGVGLGGHACKLAVLRRVSSNT